MVRLERNDKGWLDGWKLRNRLNLNSRVEDVQNRRVQQFGDLVRVKDKTCVIDLEPLEPSRLIVV